MHHPTVRFSRKDPQQFFQTIRQRVNHYFEENQIEKTGNAQMYWKTFAMFSIYFIPFIVLLTLVPSTLISVLLYVVMGIGVAGIGLSVMHDANHGSYSKHKWVNNLVSYSMNLIGANSFTWKIQHNVLHHSYTNIYELDEDIDDKPFLRLSPHGKYKKYHRFQHYYAFLLYTLATISWVIQKDFKQLALYKNTGIAKQNGFNVTKELIIMVGSKVMYFAYLIGLPILAGVPVWLAIVGFFIAHGIAGLLITTIFQLAHVVEGPDHFTPDPSGTMDNIWAVHQLKTTANFARKNKFLTWFVGGLNHQVEHHLFPNICHIHYSKISEIVKSTATEFNLPYYEYDKFSQAVASHLRVLKSFGASPVVKAA